MEIYADTVATLAGQGLETDEATVGRTHSVETCIPEQELLLAIKLHSGRFTEVRDVAAAHLHRGDPAAL